MVVIRAVLFILIFYNLPPHGPPPRVGMYWEYGAGADRARIECRSVTASPTGEILDLVVSTDDEDIWMLRVRCLPDRSGIEWLGLQDAAHEREHGYQGNVAFPALRSGEAWSLPRWGQFPISSVVRGHRVSVPAGQFANCTRVDVGPGPDLSLWIAPGVGVVRWEDPTEPLLPPVVLSQFQLRGLPGRAPTDVSAGISLSCLEGTAYVD